MKAGENMSPYKMPNGFEIAELGAKAIAAIAAVAVVLFLIIFIAALLLVSEAARVTLGVYICSSVLIVLLHIPVIVWLFRHE